MPVTSMDTSEFRSLLDEERQRIADAIAYLHEEHPRNIEDELGEIAGRGGDNHLGDMATVTFDRELDEGLEEVRTCAAAWARNKPAIDAFLAKY